MTLVRSETGGVSIGDYVWAEPGAVVDVPDELAYEIAGLNPDYSVVDEAKAEPVKAEPKADEPDDESDEDESDGEDDEDKPVKRGPGRPRKATT